MSGIIAFFRASPPKAGAAFDEQRFRRVRWQTFIAMTLAYVTFYVCRLSFTVAKSALVDLGITPTELGIHSIPVAVRYRQRCRNSAG